MTRLDRRRFLGGLIASVVAAGMPLPIGAEALLYQGGKLDLVWYLQDSNQWFMEADGRWIGGVNIMDWRFIYGSASETSDDA